MLKQWKKIKENKVLGIIGKILYIVLFLVVILMLIVVILQRVTDNSVAIGGYRMFTVATGSMVPRYEIGDILIAKEIKPEEIKVGDDIVYKGEKGSFKNKVITHEVISIKKENKDYQIITKGLANTEQDPEINQNQVYGKVLYKVKTLSFIGRMITNIYIFYFVIFIPIAILIFKQIRAIATRDEEEEEDDVEKEKSINKEKKE